MSTSISTLVKKPAPFSFSIPQKSTGIIGQTLGIASTPSTASSPNMSVYNPATAYNPPAHPQGTPKSSTITKTDPLGGTTSHQVNYQTPTAPVPTNASDANVAGKMITDTSGNAGTAKYNSMTGGLLSAVQSQNTPTTTASAPSSTNTFPGYVAGGANASTNAVNSGQQQIQNSGNGLLNTQSNPQVAASTQNGLLTNIAQNQTPEVTSAQNEYNTFSKQSPLLLSDVANNPNVAAEVSVGRGQALGQTLSAEHQALQGNVNNALQGESQQIGAANNAAGNINTAQGQGITAGNDVLGSGTTQQGQGISGLGTAASVSAPTVGGYGQTQYQPLNAGQGGGQVQPGDPFYATLQSYAQMAANGQISAVPSSITGNAQLNAQLNEMAKSINPSYNPIVSQAQSGITASQTGQNAQYQQAINQGDNLTSQANDLINTFNLNPNELNVGNGAIQKIALNTSDPNYQSLRNYLGSLASVYQPVLGDSASGQSLLDSTAKGTSISTTLNNLKSAVQAKMAGTITSPTSGSNSGGSQFSGAAWN